jgi:undecaprenyl-diphosphatase
VLAIAAAGIYVFVLYVVVLHGDLGTTPADAELLDVSRDLRARAAVDIAQVVTELGSLPATTTFVAVCAAVLAVRRNPNELVALVAGFALVYAGVQLAKAGLDRPRPDGALVETNGSSFPSGHAAYSVVYVAMAVIATRLLPGLASRAAVVLGSLALVATIGLSRIYLHVHYWSDVAGGWALGFGVFGACAAVALIVAHIRQNGAAKAGVPEQPATAAPRGPTPASERSSTST